MEKLMSVAEAATRLGLSRQRIFQLCKDGRIRGARKVGRLWVIPEGAKIVPPPPRASHSRTIEIPRAKGSGKNGGRKTR